MFMKVNLRHGAGQTSNATSQSFGHSVEDDNDLFRFRRAFDLFCSQPCFRLRGMRDGDVGWMGKCQVGDTPIYFFSKTDSTTDSETDLARPTTRIS